MGDSGRTTCVGAGNDLAARLLRIDSIKEMQKVHEHDTMRKLRLVIKAIDFTTILRNGGEGDNVIQVKSRVV